MESTKRRARLKRQSRARNRRKVSSINSLPARSLQIHRSKIEIPALTRDSAGIGSGICSILAANNCKVYLGARSEHKAKAAIEKIEKDFPEVGKKKNVLWLKLDLTEPKDVIAAAKEFMSKEKRLDILSMATLL